MTLKDKLEIGLKEDAVYRKDNLPDRQIRGPEIPTGEGRSPEIPMARGDSNIVNEETDQKEQQTRKRSPGTRPSPPKQRSRRGARKNPAGGC
jgi:hypothetical protein